MAVGSSVSMRSTMPSLGLEAAAQSKGFALDVAVDFRIRQRPQFHGRGVHMRELHAGLQAAHGAGRIELGGGARTAVSAVRGNWRHSEPVEDGGADGRDLVAADDDGVREMAGHSLGLGLRQPESPATGRFPGLSTSSTAGLRARRAGRSVAGGWRDIGRWRRGSADGSARWGS